MVESETIGGQQIISVSHPGHEGLWQYKAPIGAILNFHHTMEINFQANNQVRPTMKLVIYEIRHVVAHSEAHKFQIVTEVIFQSTKDFDLKISISRQQ